MPNVIKRLDALRWTRYLSECVRDLEDAQVCALDATLIQQVKAQLVVEKASRASWYDQTMGSSDTPTHNYVQALHAELAAVESKP